MSIHLSIALFLPLTLNILYIHAEENNEDLEISKDVASISKIGLEHSRVDPIDLGFRNQLLSKLEGIEHTPPSKDGVYMPTDPVVEDVWFCKRDYSSPCPIGFILLTNVSSETKCVPSSSYSGGCGPEDFSNTSEIYKLQWSSKCFTHWPCDKSYTPDYRIPCPEHWALSKNRCIPTPQYNGPCRDSVDFNMYTKAQRAEWSTACRSFWPNRHRKT